MRILLILFLLMSCNDKTVAKTEPEDKIQLRTLLSQFNESWKVTYITLYSSEQDSVEGEKPTQKPEFFYKDFELLSKSEIKYDDFLLLNQKMLDMVADEYMVAECFYPRHGFILENDSKKVQILICFECSRIRFSPGSERDISIEGKRDVFDNIAKKYGMKVAFPK